MVDYIRFSPNLPPDTFDTEEDGEEIREEEGYDVTFETDQGVIDPVYVETYSGDSFGKHTTLHDGCGHTDTRNGGATGFQITVKGIMTLQNLRNARENGLHEGVEVSIVLDPWVETYVCDNFTWDKPNDLNKWYSTEHPEGVEAFTFQLKTEGGEDSST